MLRSNTVPFTVDLPFRRQHVGFDHIRIPDFIWGVIQKDIDHFNLYNLQSNDQCIMVRVDPAAQSMYDLQNTHIGYNKYSFEPWTSDPVSMKVHLDERCKTWVYAEGKWVSLLLWLQLRVESEVSLWSSNSDTPSRRQLLYDKQWRMWRQNGKTFKLLDLPAEIREHTYEHCFGGRQGQNRYRYAQLGERDRWNQDRVAIQQPEVAILRLNRQVYLEASHNLFEHTLFRITRAADIHRLLVKNRRLASRIRRLEIAFDFGDFMALFYSVDTNSSRAMKCAQVFQRMQLKELILEMDAPQEKVTVTTVGNNATLTHDKPSTCHRMRVDIALKAALPWVAGNAVTISGYAKTTQKRVFEAKLAEKRQEYLDWCAAMPMGYAAWTIAEHEEWKAEEEGGVRLDGHEDMSPGKITEKSNDVTGEEEPEWIEGDAFPPLCSCEVSCALETWDAEA